MATPARRARRRGAACGFGAAHVRHWTRGRLARSGRSPRRRIPRNSAPGGELAPRSLSAEHPRGREATVRKSRPVHQARRGVHVAGVEWAGPVPEWEGACAREAEVRPRLSFRARLQTASMQIGPRSKTRLLSRLLRTPRLYRLAPRLRTRDTSSALGDHGTPHTERRAPHAHPEPSAAQSPLRGGLRTRDDPERWHRRTGDESVVHEPARVGCRRWELGMRRGDGAGPRCADEEARPRCATLRICTPDAVANRVESRGHATQHNWDTTQRDRDARVDMLSLGSGEVLVDCHPLRSPARALLALGRGPCSRTQCCNYRLLDTFAIAIVFVRGTAAARRGDGHSRALV
ncbi:hypothetical protein B0H10DRAFT_1983974 [Mycena sp. CBHHK59/15]|nr:hypothetical protein B0H10DRAFT_1983974 [Mycena sp. CBHHK59/15]